MFNRFKAPPPINYQKRHDINQVQRFEAALKKHGSSLTSCTSILEFGCGFGRLLQYVAKAAPQAQISGCDIFDKAVNACRKTFPNGRFVQNRSTPPVDLESDQFDLIYSYSVFTHLAEENHAAWLKELARLLKPGGFMIHTSKSHAFLKRAQIFSPESIEKFQLPTSVSAFIASNHPYFYIPYSSETPEYGLTIISRDYVEQNWAQYAGIDLVEYWEEALEAYPEGCHDLVILQKSL